jgi:hypothetical protein
MRVVLLCFSKQRRSTVMQMADRLVRSDVESVMIITNDPVPWTDPDNPPSVSRDVRLEWLLDREANNLVHRTQRAVTHTLPARAVTVTRSVTDRVVGSRTSSPASPTPPPPAETVAAADIDGEPDEVVTDDDATSTGTVAAPQESDDFDTPESVPETPADTPHPTAATTTAVAVAAPPAPASSKPRSRLGRLLHGYRKVMQPVSHSIRPTLLAHLMERHYWPELEPGPDLVVVACEPYAITTVARLARSNPRVIALVSLDPAEIARAAHITLADD